MLPIAFSNRNFCKDWNPVVRELTKIAPNIHFYPNLSCSEPLQSWIFGSRVALIGDAAHAHGGAHATGGSLAIDDAYALYLSLISVFPPTATHKPSAEEIGKALKLYEETRKPHAERLLNVVIAANKSKAEKIRTGKLETDEQLRSRAATGTNTNWLHEHDVLKTFEETFRRNNESSAGSAQASAKL